MPQRRLTGVALEQARGQLLTWVAHDLRPTMARIVALVGAQGDAGKGGARSVTGYRRAIAVECERLGRMIADLIELAGPTTGSFGDASTRFGSGLRPVGEPMSEPMVEPMVEPMFDIAYRRVALSSPTEGTRFP